MSDINLRRTTLICEMRHIICECTARNLSKYKLKGDPRFVIDIEYYELWITSKSIAI